LLENLGQLDADIIFIKNIDNVVPDSIKEETITYKKALAGIVLQISKDEFLLFSKSLNGQPTLLCCRTGCFFQNELCVVPPAAFETGLMIRRKNISFRKLDQTFASLRNG
jgi:hypothetical protein